VQHHTVDKWNQVHSAELFESCTPTEYFTNAERIAAVQSLGLTFLFLSTMALEQKSKTVLQRLLAMLKQFYFCFML